MSPTASTSQPPVAVPRAIPPLDYRALAWLPERVDGTEGVPLVMALVTDNDGNVTPVIELLEEANGKGHQVVLEGIQVQSTARSKPVDEILVKVHGEKNARSCMIDGLYCDSVFRTESSMRKFLIPYYECQRLLTEQELAELKDAVSDPKVSAIGHVYPSRYAAVGSDPGLLILTAKYVKSEFVGFDWLTLDKYTAQRR